MFEEVFSKTQLSINQTRIRLPFKLFYAAFYKTHSYGQYGKKFPLNRLSNFTILHIYPYGYLSSFMTALIVRQTNTSLLNLIIFLLLYLFMKMPLVLIIESQWIPKDLFLLLHKITPTFL